MHIKKKVLWFGVDSDGEVVSPSDRNSADGWRMMANTPAQTCRERRHVPSIPAARNGGSQWLPNRRNGEIYGVVQKFVGLFLNRVSGLVVYIALNGLVFSA